MRVLITTDTVGGVWDYSLSLVEGLLNKRCVVTLVSLGGTPSVAQTSTVRRLINRSRDGLQFVSTEFPLEWMQGDLRLDQSCEYLLALVSSFNPDVVHLNQMCYGSLQISVPKVVVAHSDVASWFTCCRKEDRSSEVWRERYFYLVRSGLEGADVVIAPSKFQLSQVESQYGSLGERGLVIYNGSEPREAESTKAIQAVSAGRFWDIGKNLQLLARVRWKLPVYVAGQIERDGREAQIPQGAGLLSSVGQLDKGSLHQLFDDSLIYIGPSLYEPFGLAPLEAAHSGCVLVLSDIASFREIWDDAAIYFSPDDPNELECIVDDLVADPSRCKLMAELARERARSRYNLENFVGSYCDLYRRVISGERIYHAA